MDTSFISVRAIVARARAYLRSAGAMVVLVKPQFEAGRGRVGGGGVVRDPAVHQAVLGEVRDALLALAVVPVALVASPLRGPAGNREFFMELRFAGQPVDDARIAEVVAEGTSR